MITFGSLFAGIGGMDLGLERAGLVCKWQVEIDGYARRVLAKHWPDVPKHDDVRTFPPTEDGWYVDVIAGGFPCQDISYAGKGAGLAGKRSGLWYEFARVVREIRPRYVLVENVAALLGRGLDAVLGTLADLGYDAEWSSVSACSMGAPHMRKRLFIIAYPNSVGCKAVAHEAVVRRSPARARFAGYARSMGSAKIWSESRPIGCRPMEVGNGIPSELDAIGRFGNAVVPQVAEWIGRRLIEHAEQIGGSDAARVDEGNAGRRNQVG